MAPPGRGVVNATEYEHLVAAVLTGEGWDARVTPASYDHGIDVLATRDGVRLAVQAKMYGVGRVVNEEVVLLSYGAARLADCTEVMIVTNGKLTADAQRAADKLGVTVRIVAASASPVSPSPAVMAQIGPDPATMLFGEFWERDIVPLAGQVLHGDRGRQNRILRVDGGGVLRTTSQGTKQLMRIETFRWVFDQLAAGVPVTREEINLKDAGRVSSGVVLILSTSPLIEVIQVGRKMALSMVSSGGQSSPST
jgi:hypothetical protein